MIMSTRVILPLILFMGLGSVGFAQKTKVPAEHRTVTLFSRTSNPDKSRAYDLSVYSFRFGLRGDQGKEKTRNNYELQYGNLNLNGDSDWFGVTMVTDDRSRIRILGELDLDDIKSVPYVLPTVTAGAPLRYSDDLEILPHNSDWRIAPVKVGHAYLVRSRDGRTDAYFVFRVEKLIPDKEVTISWKKLDKPKKPTIID